MDYYFLKFINILIIRNFIYLFIFNFLILPIYFLEVYLILIKFNNPIDFTKSFHNIFILMINLLFHFIMLLIN